MCDPITLAVSAIGAGSVLKAGAAVTAGNQQKDYYDAQADINEQQADQERDAAVAQAEKYRRAGRRQAATADASYAASGVSVGVGTPVRVNEQIYRDSEDDAYNTILTGKRRGDTLDTQASLTRQAGTNTHHGGVLGAASSLLSAAGQFGMWKLG